MSVSALTKYALGDPSEISSGKSNADSGKIN